MEIVCKCGCGGKLESKDKRGRKRFFIHGHNGRNPSEATLKKLRDASSGKNNSFYGKSHSQKTKLLMKKNHKGMKGKKHSAETKQRQSETDRRVWLGKRGKETPNWKGGVNPLYLSIRTCLKMESWKKSVFSRDKFICQNCGYKKGGNLNAHHIYQFSKIITDNNIKTLLDAELCCDLWDINNGITLCKDCHMGKHRKNDT